MKKSLLLPLLLVTCFCLAQDAKEIIGKPFKTGKLIVAQYDLLEPLNWFQMKTATSKLGNGWRLPTKAELNYLYQIKEKIGNFANTKQSFYWSATDLDSNYAWYQDFGNGNQIKDNKDKIYFVRAVKGQVMGQDLDDTPAAIIGKPIRIGNLLVAQNDFPNKMNWKDAKKACATLGRGWRLPNRGEFHILYQNKYKIDGFANSYWSSTEWEYVNFAWVLDFTNEFPFIQNGSYTYYVRAVNDSLSGVSDISITTDMMIDADSARIIGKAIIIGKLVVSENDFPTAMNWDEAKAVCTLLGKGWRLPTKDELNILYQNKFKIGGFEGDNDHDVHWSSTENDSLNAWFQIFTTGNQFSSSKDYTFYVRAVRSL
jgi:hypothetical protein